MNISYDARMKPDFSDLGFTWVNASDGTETELPFWIEQKSDSGWAYIWVRVKEVPASDYATLYMYFNGSSLSKSNISRTFIFGDDFSANSSDNYYSNGTLEWADGYLRITSGYIHPKNQLLTNNIIVEARTNYSNNDSAWLFSGVYALAENTTGPDLYYTYTHKAKYGRNDTSKSLCYDSTCNPCIEGGVDINFSDPNFYIIGLYATSDGNRRAEFERNITKPRGASDTRQGYFGYFTDTDSRLDWFLVRKYVSLVPSYSINREEEYSNLTVSIDYPDDSVANNTTDIFFGYTPMAADYDIVNCSLYTTINGAWEVTQVNSTPVLNNSLNLFNLTGLLNKTFVWAVGCMDTFHSTHDALYLTANRTLTIAKPYPVEPAAGGGGMYLAPPAPLIITSDISYLGFHPSYALNGTREYLYNTTSQSTTITLRITNLFASDRDFALRDTIPKDMAVDIDNVLISPVPTTVYNPDPELGWNFTLASQQTFETKYVFNKRVSLESFNSMDLPVINEIVKVATETTPPAPVQVPVSPTTVVTTTGGGTTGLVVSTFTNPLFALLVIAIIVLAVVFFRAKKRK